MGYILHERRSLPPSGDGSYSFETRFLHLVRGGDQLVALDLGDRLLPTLVFADDLNETDAKFPEIQKIINANWE